MSGGPCARSAAVRVARGVGLSKKEGNENRSIRNKVNVTMPNLTYVWFRFQ